MADLRKPAAQGSEEARIDQEFSLLLNAFLNPQQEVRSGKWVRSLKELNRGMERFEQR